MQPQPPASARGQLWGIVLAGGEGVRLRPLIRRLYGEDRPKQFASLVGGHSLLRRTLDRVRIAVPTERTVLVTLQNHNDYLQEALDGAPVRRVLVQPEDRGTAAGILLPCHWIQWTDPDAFVAVFPSDHFVGDEQVFMEHVADMFEVAREHPDWMVLAGASPTEPDADYGWLEPGEVVAWSPGGGPISRVRQFWEKPSSLTARACLDKGWLWNTFVLVAKASLMLDVSNRFLSRLHERLALLHPFKDTELEAWSLQQAYALSPKMSFSRSVLELCPPNLVVSRLPPIAWSDWGTPDRVIKSLKRAGLLPRWFGDTDAGAPGRERGAGGPP
jgi:mannose-1-phosphate guanylyltransferase